MTNSKISPTRLKFENLRRRSITRSRQSNSASNHRKSDFDQPGNQKLLLTASALSILALFGGITAGVYFLPGNVQAQSPIQPAKTPDTGGVKKVVRIASASGEITIPESMRKKVISKFEKAKKTVVGKQDDQGTNPYSLEQSKKPTKKPELPPAVRPIPRPAPVATLAPAVATPPALAVKPAPAAAPVPAATPAPTATPEPVMAQAPAADPSLKALTDDVVSTLLKLKKQETAKAPEALAPTTNDLRNAISALVTEASRKGKSNEYIQSLIDNALAGRNAIPTALAGADGKLDTAMLLASILPKTNTGKIGNTGTQYMSALESESQAKGQPALPSIAKKPKAVRYVIVKRGDNLSRIALKVYGDMFAYPKIFKANRTILSNVNTLKPGQRLVIPR